MSSAYRPVRARVATSGEIDAIVDTLATAFFHDPLWGPAFPDEQRRAVQAAAMWRLSVTSALRYPWTLVTPNVEAAARDGQDPRTPLTAPVTGCSLRRRTQGQPGPGR